MNMFNDVTRFSGIVDDRPVAKMFQQTLDATVLSSTVLLFFSHGMHQWNHNL